jgi:polygalacturonase
MFLIGKQTFAYEEENVDLIQIGGTDITVQGAPGHVLDGNGPAWWDGEGSNGGKAKSVQF